MYTGHVTAGGSICIEVRWQHLRCWIAGFCGEGTGVLMMITISCTLWEQLRLQ